MSNRKVKIELVKSKIACSPKQKQTLTALGLRKRHQIIIKNDNPALQGMLRQVNHLVKVSINEE